jgi:hypothetical protein
MTLSRSEKMGRSTQTVWWGGAKRVGKQNSYTDRIFRGQGYRSLFTVEAGAQRRASITMGKAEKYESNPRPDSEAQSGCNVFCLDYWKGHYILSPCIPPAHYISVDQHFTPVWLRDCSPPYEASVYISSFIPDFPANISWRCFVVYRYYNTLNAATRFLIDGSCHGSGLAVPFSTPCVRG